MGSKASGKAELSKPFDTEHGITEFDFCPTESQSCSGPVFPRYSHIPFGMVMCILWRCMLEYIIYFLMFFNLMCMCF